MSYTVIFDEELSGPEMKRTWLNVSDALVKKRSMVESLPSVGSASGHSKATLLMTPLPGVCKKEWESLLKANTSLRRSLTGENA